MFVSSHFVGAQFPTSHFVRTDRIPSERAGVIPGGWLHRFSVRRRKRRIGDDIPATELDRLVKQPLDEEWEIVEWDEEAEEDAEALEVMLVMAQMLQPQLQVQVLSEEEEALLLMTLASSI